jgi:hypothetical protein
MASWADRGHRCPPEWETLKPGPHDKLCFFSSLYNPRTDNWRRKLPRQMVSSLNTDQVCQKRPCLLSFVKCPAVPLSPARSLEGAGAGFLMGRAWSGEEAPNSRVLPAAGTSGVALRWTRFCRERYVSGGQAEDEDMAVGGSKPRHLRSSQIFALLLGLEKCFVIQRDSGHLVFCSTLSRIPLYGRHRQL